MKLISIKNYTTQIDQDTRTTVLWPFVQDYPGGLLPEE